jgi:AcrR family transcriptional regulator
VSQPPATDPAHRAGLASVPADRPRTAGKPAAAVGEETRARLLAAAEEILAERGFDAFSMRAVTHAAGVSVSAANYHFGRKEGLLREAFRRRVEPLNQERMRRIDAVLVAAGDGAPLLEDVLEACMRPMFELHAAGHWESLVRLLALLYSDPPELAVDIREELVQPTHAKIREALGRAMPGLCEASLIHSHEMTLGVLARGVGEGETGDGDEGALERIVAYAAGGIRAVVAVERAEGGR